jgi:hypothetical protein
MDDVSVKWGSTGFEKIQQEFQSFEKMVDRLGTAATTFQQKAAHLSESMKGAAKMPEMKSDLLQPMQASLQGVSKIFAEVSGSWKELFVGGGPLGGITKAIGTAASAAANFAMEIVKVTAVLTGLAAVAGGVALAAIGEFTKKIVEETDAHRRLELSLHGLLGSWETVGKMHEFAIGYAVKYGVEIDKVMATLRKFALMPSIGGAIRRGDLEQMERYMDFVRRIQTLRPEAGMETIAGALQQATVGRYAQIQRMLGAPMPTIAAQAGFGLGEVKASPEKMFAALESYTKAKVPMSDLEKQAGLLGNLLTSIRQIYHHWLEEIGNTGIYDNVITKLKSVKESILEFMKTDQMKGWTEKISGFLEDVVNKISSVFTKGIDWTKLANWEDLRSTFGKIAENAKEEFLKVWPKMKQPLIDALNEAFKAAAGAISFSIGQIFIPVGVAIAKSISEASIKFWKEHPFVYEAMSMIPGFAPTMAAMGITKTMVGKEGAAEKPAEKEEETKKPGDELRKWGEKWADELRRMEKAQIEWHQSAEDLLKWTDTWAKMAKKLAEAPSFLERIDAEDKKQKEHQAMREKWETGKITDVEWRGYLAKGEAAEEKRGRMRDFESDYEKKLKGILAMPELTGMGAAKTQMSIYEKLFGVSMEKGDISGAKEYQTKALDAMVQAQKDATKLEQDQVGYLQEIADNTAEMAGKAGSQNQETTSPAAAQRSENLTAITAPIATDDIYWDVKRGFGSQFY